MICKHMLFVLKQKGVHRIPTSLIAKRWTKTDKEFYRTEPSMKEPVGKNCDDPDMQALRRGSTRTELELYHRLGCSSGETLKFFKAHMADGIRKLQSMISKGNPFQGTHREIKKEENPYAHVKNPTPPDTKCPKGPKKDRRRRCGNCKELGHNRTTCPNPPLDSVEQVDDPEDDSAQIPLEFDVKEEYFWSQSSSQSKKNKTE